jgi:signal transduction histidine kinase
MKSYFAPAERLDASDVAAQHRMMKGLFPLETLFASLDSMVLVLNRQRQIVESYPAASPLDSDGLIASVGLRPGEALGCVNASANEGGCGTSPACRFCGAVQAIQECLAEQAPVRREFTLRAEGRRGGAGEYLLTAVPFPWEGEIFVLLFFENRADEKRRQVMERLFFHDLLNTASGLSMHLDLLSRRELPEEVKEEIAKIAGITRTLIGEIDDQKILANAENGTLQVRRDFIHSLEFLSSLKSEFAPLAAERKVALELRPFAQVFLQQSDAGLLRRVVANMVKNAVEASGPGETVLLDCREESERNIFSVWNSSVMEEEARYRVFTRSFSTKGGNRGLGTYSMKLFGEGYLGGTVRFSSREGEGTFFSVSLPSHPSQL